MNCVSPSVDRIEDEIVNLITIMVPIMYHNYFLNHYVTQLEEVVCFIMVHYEI